MLFTMNQLKQQLCCHFSQLFLRMNNSRQLQSPIVRYVGIVISGHGYIRRNLFPGSSKALNHLHGNLVIIADNPIHRNSAFCHLLNGLIRMNSTILRIKPDHMIRFIRNPGFLQRLYISLVTVLPLDIIRLKHANDRLMPCIDQILRNKITTHRIIHKHPWLLLHRCKAALDKHVRNTILFQLFIQVGVLTINLTFARLDNNSVNVLLKKLF